MYLQALQERAKSVKKERHPPRRASNNMEKTTGTGLTLSSSVFMIIIDALAAKDMSDAFFCVRDNKGRDDRIMSSEHKGET